MAAFSMRRFGSQGFPVISLSIFGSRELNAQLPFTVQKGFTLSALSTVSAVRNGFHVLWANEEVGLQEIDTTEAGAKKEP